MGNGQERGRARRHHHRDSDAAGIRRARHRPPQRPESRGRGPEDLRAEGRDQAGLPGPAPGLRQRPRSRARPGPRRGLPDLFQGAAVLYGRGRRRDQHPRQSGRARRHPEDGDGRRSPAGPPRGIHSPGPSQRPPGHPPGPGRQRPDPVGLAGPGPGILPPARGQPVQAHLSSAVPAHRPALPDRGRARIPRGRPQKEPGGRSEVPRPSHRRRRAAGGQLRDRPGPGRGGHLGHRRPDQRRQVDPVQRPSRGRPGHRHPVPGDDPGLPPGETGPRRGRLPSRGHGRARPSRAPRREKGHRPGEEDRQRRGRTAHRPRCLPPGGRRGRADRPAASREKGHYRPEQERSPQEARRAH